MQAKTAITINNLSFAYKDKEALKNVSLRLDRGKIIGLFGPNGAGKTTLIKILTGFLQIAPNKAFLKGIDVSNLSRDLKRSIGVLPQENNLYAEMSVYDNLKLHLYLFGVSRKEHGSIIEHWLKKVGLWERRKESISKLSGGMKRRVTFIRSILHDPDIMFLDEPTLGLDVQSRLAFWDWIKELKTLNKVVLLTTHGIEEAEKICDEIIILDKGEVLEFSTPLEARIKHVGKTILELEGDLNLSKLQQLLPNHNISEKNNKKFIIKLRDLSESQAILQKLFDSDIEYNHFSTKETTLEEVFLKLTGRRISD